VVFDCMEQSMSRGKKIEIRATHPNYPYTPTPRPFLRTEEPMSAQGIYRFADVYASKRPSTRFDGETPEEWRHAMKKMSGALLVTLLASAGLIACHGSPAQCGKGTHLEGRVCVADLPPQTGKVVSGRGAAEAASASSEAQKPSDEKPSEARLMQIARRLLARSEDSKAFAINDVRVANTVTEGKVLTAKIEYTVTPTKTDVLFSSTGAKHILPLGSVRSGTRMEGGFKLTMKKYDRGWDVDGFEQE